MTEDRAIVLTGNDAALVARESGGEFEMHLPPEFNAAGGNLTPGILALVFFYVSSSSPSGKKRAAELGLDLIKGGRGEGELDG